MSTTSTSAQVPKLRFPGFEGEWKAVAMGELLSFKNGYDAEKEQYGTGMKFIKVLDIIQNDYITHDRIIGCVTIPEKDFEKNKVHNGDLLFQRSSETLEEVGQANVSLDKDKPATFGGLTTFHELGRPFRALVSLRGKPRASPWAAIDRAFGAQESAPTVQATVAKGSALEKGNALVRQTQAWMKGLLQQMFV